MNDEETPDEKAATMSFNEFLSKVVSDCVNGQEIWDRAEAEDERHASMSGPEAVE